MKDGPRENEVEQFRKGIWETESEHNKQTDWIQLERDKYSDVPIMNGA